MPRRARDAARRAPVRFESDSEEDEVVASDDENESGDEAPAEVAVAIDADVDVAADDNRNESIENVGLHYNNCFSY